MKYPVDAEKYIAALRLEFGPNKAAEEAHRVFIPAINAAYEDGLRGESGYPLDMDVELRAFEEASGRPLERVQANPLLPPLIQWLNSAYAQGRRDAAI